MYKSRLTKYGMYKHNRAPDMAFMIRKKRQRDAQGKRSSFVVRSKEISAKDIDRYIERKRGQDPDFNEAPAGAPTPIHILCLSLPPSPWPEGAQGSLMIQEENSTLPSDTGVVTDRPRKGKRSTSRTMESRNGLVSQRAYPYVRGQVRNPSVPVVVTVPEIFLKYELMFTTISNYIGGSIGNGTWFISESGQLKATKQTVDPADFQNLLWQATKFFKGFLFVQGRLLASKAFSLLPAILREENPRALGDVLDTFLLLSGFGFVELCAMLQDHVRQLANIVLPERHIWRQICISISLPDPAHAEVMTRSWRCLTDSLSRSVGKFSNISVTSEVDLMRRMYEKDLRRGELRLRQVLTDYEQTTRKLDDTKLYTVERLAEYLLHQRKYAEAEALLEDSLLPARQSGGLSKYREARLKDVLARAQYAQAKVGVAEENLRDAIAIFAKVYGLEGPLVMNSCAQLEPWLREWGREEEADELRAEIDKMVVQTTLVSTRWMSRRH